MEEVNALGQTSCPESSIASKSQVVDSAGAIRLVGIPVFAAVEAFKKEDSGDIRRQQPACIKGADGDIENLGFWQASGFPNFGVVPTQKKPLLRQRQQDIGTAYEAAHSGRRKASDFDRPGFPQVVAPEDPCIPPGE